MKFKIRKGIWETSSSSATALTMISASGKTEIPQLTSTFKLIKGAYYTDCVEHIYLNTWMDKLSYIAEDTPEWHEMFKQATGQDFEMWDIVEDNEKNRKKIKDNGLCYEPLPIDENNLVVRDPELGYICGYHLFCKCLIIRANERRSYHFELPLSNYFYAQHFLDEKTIEKHPDYELYRLYDEEISKEFIPELWREFVFNSAIAINIGGDCYYNDTQTLPVLDSPEDTKPLQRRGFAIFDGFYKNGTEMLIIGMDGTKFRIFDENSVPEYPESIDLKITDYCANSCAFCYENCTADGKHGEKAKFLETLPEFVELAVGGGNALSHPNYPEFGEITKFANLTVHEKDFRTLFSTDLRDIHAYEEYNIYKFRALGISVTNEEDAIELADILDEKGYYSFFNDGVIGMEYAYRTDMRCISEGVEAVIHVVNGIVNESVLKHLYDKSHKLLILGYKTKGRGVGYAKDPSFSENLAENQKWLYDNIEEVAKHFKVVAFDTLALKQLDMKRFLTDEQWDSYFMGDDGLHSMYVDLVKGEYGISSTDERRWPLTDDIRDMFRHVREVVLSEKKKEIQGGR